MDRTGHGETVELALLHISRRRTERAGDDTLDLALLDTATGRRRTLVPGVFWTPPRWSADGRRVRYEQRIPARGFVWHEIDVETGAVREVADDRPDGSSLPGCTGSPTLSPGRRWLAYQYGNRLLAVARTDGPEAFALRFALDYQSHGGHWAPCGTRLATHLAAGDDSGAYVIDLRTGELRRVSPDWRQGTFDVQGWTPDGEWVLATRSRWHDPETYDYSCYDVWLLAADGSATRRLTADDGCPYAAVRPAQDAPAPDGESELTFAWAQRIPTAGPAAGQALAAVIDLDLAAGPPFAIVVRVRTDDGLIHHRITGCASIADGFARLDAFLSRHDYRAGADFAVILPRYSTDDPGQELTMLEIAHAVLAETGQRLWRFDRESV